MKISQRVCQTAHNTLQIYAASQRKELTTDSHPVYNTSSTSMPQDCRKHLVATEGALFLHSVHKFLPALARIRAERRFFRLLHRQNNSDCVSIRVRDYGACKYTPF
jgi:hypothetical protein